MSARVMRSRPALPRPGCAPEKPRQVMKYCARLSTTPMRLSSSSPSAACLRARQMRRALLGPMPGTRSSISKGARFTSTGNSP